MSVTPRFDVEEPTPTAPPVAVIVGSEPAYVARRDRRPLFAALATVALLLAGMIGVALREGFVSPPPGEAPLVSQAIEAVVPKAPEPPPRAPREPARVEPRADAHLSRAGYGYAPGGVVFVPKTFSSADGTYDLYIHFHGNTHVVLESAEYAGLNAIVAIVNLGVNSAPYLDAYEVPGSYERLLAAVARVLVERGLEGPKLRRVAVGSWSGGYGAVSRLLEREHTASMLDAVLVLDGIHCGFLDENPNVLNVGIISPFLAGAKRAAEGKLLFSITHSEIDPVTYAGTYRTAGYLLDAVHGLRGEPRSIPEHVALRAAEGAVSKKREKWMEPIYEANVGSFHVRGYRGNTAEHHMAHLLQMGATVFPELVARWK